MTYHLSYYTIPGGARRRKPLRMSNLRKPESCQAKTSPHVSRARLMLGGMLGRNENRILRLYDLLSRDPCERIEEGVKCIRATRECHRVTAQDIREGIVKPPEVALGTPNGVFGVVPLLDNIRKRSLGNRAATIGANDHIVRFLVAKLAALVGIDTLRVIAPCRGELTERTREEHRKITKDELRMTTSDLDLVMEGEVIAHERRGASVDTSRERLVVRVTQADNRADTLRKGEVGNARDLEKSEVALTIASQSVTLLHNFHARISDDSAQALDEARVRDRMP